MREQIQKNGDYILKKHFVEEGKNMTIKKKLYICFVVACLLGIMAGCSDNNALPSETNLPDSETPPDIPTQEGSLPTVSNVLPDKGTTLKKYDNYAEAYLNILKENKLTMTNTQLSDSQKNMGLDIGDGEIAVVDVLGNETPELLYIYTDANISNSIEIYTYTEQEGAKSVFDSELYTAVGGEGNYCVFLTRDRDLMLYYSYSGAYSFYGFWPIIPKIEPENVDPKEPSLNNDDCDAAQLYFSLDHENKEAKTYKQYGKDVPKEQFHKAANDMMGNISQVIFQGPVLGDYGLRLYKDQDFWKDVPPFEANNMTYDEAVAWLEAQIGNQ